MQRKIHFFHQFTKPIVPFSGRVLFFGGKGRKFHHKTRRHVTGMSGVAKTPPLPPASEKNTIGNLADKKMLSWFYPDKTIQ